MEKTRERKETCLDNASQKAVMEENAGKGGYRARATGTFCNTALTGFHKYNRPL